MDDFFPLDTWFSVRINVDNPFQYTRYDLCLKPDSDKQELAAHLALLIARLRLSTDEFLIWKKSWNNATPIPTDWIQRFRDRFWRGFISSTATEKAGGQEQPDKTALQGYVGELLLGFKYQVQPWTFS